MEVTILGIHYKSVDLSIFEEIARGESDLVDELAKLEDIDSFVVLRTCNRIEIYMAVEDSAAAAANAVVCLQRIAGEKVAKLCYVYSGYSSFFHLAKVSAGLDSMIIGESQIQHQVKICYQKASQRYKLSPLLHFFFQKALHIGKLIRTAFHLPQTNVSVEAVVAELFKAFFFSSSRPKVLFVGSSMINHSIISYMQARRLGELFLMTRRLKDVKECCAHLSVPILSSEKLASWIDYDFVVVATKAEGFVLKESDANAFIEPNKVIPTSVVIDLGVPRNVDPKLAAHPQLTVFTIEEIHALVQKKQQIAALDKKGMEEMLEKAARSAWDYLSKKSPMQEISLGASHF